MSRRNARHRMLRCQSSTRGSGDSSTMPRREYGPAGPRSRERRPTSRPHAGFSPTDNCAGTRICIAPPIPVAGALAVVRVVAVSSARTRGGSIQTAQPAAATSSGIPAAVHSNGMPWDDDSSVAIQWDTCRRRSWPMPNAPGSAAIEPGTLTCRIRDPPPRSRSLSWPARGGRTTGVAGGKPPVRRCGSVCTFLHTGRVLVCVMLAKWQPSNPPCLSGGFRSTHRPFSIPRGSHARSFDSCPETSSSGRATRALT